jgi:hypothetical protein
MGSVLDGGTFTIPKLGGQGLVAVMRAAANAGEKIVVSLGYNCDGTLTCFVCLGFTIKDNTAIQSDFIPSITYECNLVIGTLVIAPSRRHC